jgi:hypothetical protein
MLNSYSKDFLHRTKDFLHRDVKKGQWIVKKIICFKMCSIGEDQTKSIGQETTALETNE